MVLNKNIVYRLVSLRIWVTTHKTQLINEGKLFT